MRSPEDAVDSPVLDKRYIGCDLHHASDKRDVSVLEATALWRSLQQFFSIPPMSSCYTLRFATVTGHFVSSLQHHCGIANQARQGEKY